MYGPFLNQALRLDVSLRNGGATKLLEGYGRVYFDALEATGIYAKQYSLKVNAQDVAVIGAPLAGAGATR